MVFDLVPQWVLWKEIELVRLLEQLKELLKALKWENQLEFRKVKLLGLGVETMKEFE